MPPTRRDLLTAFLGLPLALEACRFPTPAARFDGEIVGASVGLGHKLRDGFRPDIPPDAWREIDVVIVGAGIAGLTAAWRLAREGHTDHVVLELEPESGGTSRSGQNAVSAYPWGAHYVPVPNAESRGLVTLLREMGVVEGFDAHGTPVVGEQHLVRAPEERLFCKGQWWDGLYLRAGAGTDDLRQLEAFHQEINRWVLWRDARGRRAFTIPTSQASDDAEITALDRFTMRDFLDRHAFTSPRLRWLVNYACRDDYGTTLETTSAWAGIFYFASRVRQVGDESADLMAWPEGNGKLAHYLRDRALPRIRTRTAVTDIIPGADGSRIEVRIFDDARGKAEGYRARRVIFTAPIFLAPYLIRPLREEKPAWSREFDHSPWMVANLTLSDRPKQVGFPLAWDNVLYDSPSLGYVTATHQSLRDFGPTVLTYYYPLVGADSKAERKRLLETDWHGWTDIIRADLRPAHPDLDPLLTRIDVMRWGHAMIRPRPGFIWGGARQQAMQPYRGIHFAHTDLSGIALFEEANDHGLRAAEEVLTALGRRVETVR